MNLLSMETLAKRGKCSLRSVLIPCGHLHFSYFHLQILDGCWHSCHSPCPSTGRTFVADAIISNPPAFAHVHCAQALGIPLLTSFSESSGLNPIFIRLNDSRAMPWSPTTAFPHPLANITTTNIGRGLSNYLSYAATETLQWQG